MIAGTILTLDVNNAGHAFIGACDYDEDEMGVRAYVLSSGGARVAPSVMRRRFDDMVRLMGDNVESEVTPLFDTAEALAPVPFIGPGLVTYLSEVQNLHAERTALDPDCQV